MATTAGSRTDRDIFQMGEQVGQPPLERRQILLFERPLGGAPVMLERPHRGHHHHGIWPEPRLTAFDIEELFRAEIRTGIRLRSRRSLPTSAPCG